MYCSQTHIYTAFSKSWSYSIDVNCSSTQRIPKDLWWEVHQILGLFNSEISQDSRRFLTSKPIRTVSFTEIVAFLETLMNRNVSWKNIQMKTKACHIAPETTNIFLVFQWYGYEILFFNMDLRKNWPLLLRYQNIITFT